MVEIVIGPEDFQVFVFEQGRELRVVIQNDKPMFYAKDVCDALGYKNPRDAVLEHCKEAGVAKYDVSYPSGSKTVNFIDEANVYRLIMRSKLPRAEEFQDWVCGVVLPSIRKTGKYERTEIEKPNRGEIYRLNELRVWLYHHGFYNSRAKGNGVYISSRILLRSMHLLGFIYRDVKNRNWVATHYAIENNFCLNIPVKQFVTFDREGIVNKTNTRYVFALTESGANEYARELRRLAKKYKIRTTMQTKLLPELIK